MKYEHQYGDETRFENQVFTDPEYLPKDLNSETNISNLINNIENCPDPYENFIRGVIMALEDSGVKGDFDYNKIIDREDESIERKKQIKTLIAAIRDKYKEKNREITRTIRNWIKGGSIDTNSRNGNTFPKKENSNHKKGNRFKLYEFCMVMDMDLNKTVNFFWKYFGTIPFNLKNRDDVIFYYCLANGKELSAVENIYTKIKDIDETDKAENTKTISLSYMIDSFDDEKIIDFINTSSFNYETFYSTARDEIKHLVNRCVKLNEHNVSSRDALLNDLYGENQYYKGSTALSDIKRHIHDLCKWGDKLIISKQDLNNIFTDKIITYEKTRQILIILNLYSFYKENEQSCESNNESYDALKDIDIKRKEFRENTNELLLNVGFEPIYPISTFDFMILYIANQKNPLECLKRIVMYYFEQANEK